MMSAERHVCRGCGDALPSQHGNRKWCSERCRKDQYAGTCEVCGGVTDGTTPGRNAPARVCQNCRTWSEEAIIEAMQRWAEEHGGVPPSCADWCHAGPDHPHAHATKRHGGWNELLLRAGFALRCDRRPETYEWIVDQLQRGVPTAEIAHALGVSVACIYERLKYRGLTVTGVRNGVAA